MNLTYKIFCFIYVGLLAGGAPPKIKNRADGKTTVVSHREYIGDISGTDSFQSVEYPIQPGLSTTFPWLSSMASAFQQYRILGMEFFYRSTSADSVSAANTALGSVMMVHQADANASALTSKYEVLAMENVADIKPSKSAICKVEADRGVTNSKHWLFVRGSNLPPNSTLKDYDFGKFVVCTQGMGAASNTIGEIWVNYEIEFTKPRQAEAPFGVDMLLLPPRFLNGTTATSPASDVLVLFNGEDQDETVHYVQGSIQECEAGVHATNVSLPMRVTGSDMFCRLMGSTDRIYFNDKSYIRGIYRLSLQFISGTARAFNCPLLTAGSDITILANNSTASEDPTILTQTPRWDIIFSINSTDNNPVATSNTYIQFGQNNVANYFTLCGNGNASKCQRAVLFITRLPDVMYDAHNPTGVHVGQVLGQRAVANALLTTAYNGVPVTTLFHTPDPLLIADGYHL